MSETTQLMVVEQQTAVQIFAPGAPEKILDAIEIEARKAAAGLDVSTETGRKGLASVAYKIARTKTFLDDQGKDLVSDLKKQSGAIDAERKKFRDRLDTLKDEIRKPLTEFEEADKQRIAAHEFALSRIEDAGQNIPGDWQNLSAQAIRERMQEIESESRNWEEFNVRAAGTKAIALKRIGEALAAREKYDCGQAELARLRAEAAERERQERENRIAAEATAKAEAAAKAREEQAEREAAEREAAIQREKEAALQRERDAENRRIEAEKKAARDAQEAAAKAKRDQEAAVEAERQRAAEIQRKADEDRRRREANQKHRTKILDEIEAALLDATKKDEPLSQIQVDAIVAALDAGRIPHIAIEY